MGIIEKAIEYDVSRLNGFVDALLHVNVVFKENFPKDATPDQAQVALAEVQNYLNVLFEATIKANNGPRAGTYTSHKIEDLIRVVIDLQARKVHPMMPPTEARILMSFFHVPTGKKLDQPEKLFWLLGGNL